MRRVLSVVLVGWIWAGCAGLAAGQEAACETKAEVPALTAFHEVIYPLWHEAWPERDTAKMKELLPQVQQHLAVVEKAELPGILRDKREKWDAGLQQMREIVARYERAARADDAAALAAAVEELHAAYESLVRLVRPVMAELDAYHQVLYRLYHYDWPAGKLDAIRQDAAALEQACTQLAGAAVPKRFATREAKLRSAFADLCAATRELVTASAGTDLGQLGSVVEKVHSAYQAAEGVFD
ncbi:MAG: hypothetical protein HXY19_05835 [Thermoanaerobaculaceae bacterium]|nr:hypothetical protein [Thermoanaerobaculaceae bacterium]